MVSATMTIRVSFSVLSGRYILLHVGRTWVLLDIEELRK